MDFPDVLKTVSSDDDRNHILAEEMKKPHQYPLNPEFLKFYSTDKGKLHAIDIFKSMVKNNAGADWKLLDEIESDKNTMKAFKLIEFTFRDQTPLWGVTVTNILGTFRTEMGKIDFLSYIKQQSKFPEITSNLVHNIQCYFHSVGAKERASEFMH